ncbi:MAG: prolipoprotein diacylglyceryl transferase [Elusimicrobia bacterium]|nr:prolipoprotein diacylglyceryl transferase [Elusimicrobiota bacterium]
MVPLLIGGILGARIFYVIFHAAEFSGVWLDTLKIWQGGLMWQGGFLGGVMALAIFVHRRKIPFLSGGCLFPGGRSRASRGPNRMFVRRLLFREDLRPPLGHHVS